MLGIRRYFHGGVSFYIIFIIPLLQKTTTWYQYGFFEPEGPIRGKHVNGNLVHRVSEWFVRRMRLPLGTDEMDKLTSPSASNTAASDVIAAVHSRFDVSINIDHAVRHEESSLSSEVSSDASSIDFPETNLIIIFTRRRTRRILNEDELAAHLFTQFNGKYEVVHMGNEKYSFEEQIKLLRRARVVVGMHGAILIMGKK